MRKWMSIRDFIVIQCLKTPGVQDDRRVAAFLAKLEWLRTVIEEEQQKG